MNGAGESAHVGLKGVRIPRRSAGPGIDTGEVKPNRGQLRALIVQVGTDLFAVSSAMLMAFCLRSAIDGDQLDRSKEYLLLGAMSLPMWAALLWRARLYSHVHTAGRLDEFRRLVKAVLAAVGGIAIVGFLLKLYVSRSWLALTGALAILAMTAARTVTRRYFASIRSKGDLLQPIVLVGANVEGLALAAMLAAEPRLGYRVVGFLDDESPAGTVLLGGQCVLGEVRDTLAVARAAGATGAVVATTAVDPSTSNRLTRELTDAGLQVELTSSLCDISAGRLFVRPLGRFPVVHVDPVPRDGWQARAKRAFDVAVAGCVGAVAAPVIGLAALAIKLDTKGPIHFRQVRIGKDGKPFEILKLRTMVSNAEQLTDQLLSQNQADGPLFKLRNDPRITRVGRVLRALSLDELPQLWNVLRGDMSLVGPRPALPSEVSGWSPELHGRLAVKPGMTGMWQVSGNRRWHSFDEYARLDLYYVDNWSIWTDLAILAKTVPAVLFNRPAK